MHVWWLRWWLLLQDMAALRRACEGVDVVVHCAGYGAPAHLGAAHSAEQFYASLLRPVCFRSRSRVPVSRAGERAVERRARARGLLLPTAAPRAAVSEQP